MSVEALFTSYYKNNTWKGGGKETTCGSGSTLECTEKLRATLPGLFEKFNFNKVFDAPCGDYNWFQHLKCDVDYTGGEIVRDFIINNNRLYANDSTRFIHFDILNGMPPENQDAWLCRDCLIHFSFEHIYEFINNFIKSGIPYLLVSTYHTCEENVDITTGWFRPINLEIPPFNFPRAIEYLEDSTPNTRPRRIGLWHRDTLMGIKSE